MATTMEDWTLAVAVDVAAFADWVLAVTKEAMDMAGALPRHAMGDMDTLASTKESAHSSNHWIPYIILI